MVLALGLAVGIASGGLTGDAPAVVDRAAAVAMLWLALGLFLALLLTGVGARRTGLPSRGAGLVLVLAAVPFLVPALFANTGVWMGELVGLGLFVTWTASFGGIGQLLRGG